MKRLLTISVGALSAAAVVLGSLGCDRRAKTTDGPETTGVVATQPTASTTQPTTQSTTHPASVGRLTEPQLLQFISVTGSLLSTLGHPVEPSPAGLNALAQELETTPALAEVLAKANLSKAGWYETGKNAWAAWAVAQVEYNAEEPLRLNEAALAEARRRRNVAEQSTTRQVRILTEDERVALIASSREDADSALRRAADWARRAEQLDADAAEAETASRGVGTGNGVGPSRPPQGDPFAPPGPFPGPPPGIPPSGPDGPSDAPAPVDIARRMAAAREYAEQRRHDAIIARRHEADERQRARDATAIAEHPELPASTADRRQLVSNAQTQAVAARQDEAALAAEHRRLIARRDEDRRVDREDRKNDPPEADVQLLRTHLLAFNAIWGMGEDGKR